jgi:hypothetical protein
MENPTDTPGGMGGDRAARWEQRQHLRVIEEAVYDGWEVPVEASKAIPGTLRSIMDDPNASTRDRIRAAECLAHLRRERIDAVLQLDRIARLDAGTATERVEVMEGLTDSQLAAVARSIASPAAPAAPEPPKPCRKRKRKP